MVRLYTHAGSKHYFLQSYDDDEEAIDRVG